MAVHKITPNYLNKDDDERLVKSVEMTDAVNIRVSSDADGDAFVIKNAYGNTAISLGTSLPSGTNKVIGSVSDEQLGFIFYFVWNSNNEHSIYRYSTGSNTSVRIIKDSVLSFTENGFVKGNIFVNINGDVLLYFSDGLTAPKKINTTKALINGYPQLLTGTDNEKLAVLTVAKAPPLDPPSYNIVNNSDLLENNIKDKFFQFAYKYVYEDGEHSALSPYSSLSVSENQLKRGFTNLGQDNFYNQINIFAKYIQSDVSKILMYAREGNEGTFYEIAEVNNVPTGTYAIINFTNSKVGSALSLTEQNKLYDNVPQFAESQEIINGRLIYGGYTEGYANVNIDKEIIANYKKTENLYDVSIAVTSAPERLELGIGYGTMPAIFTDDATIYMNVVISSDEIIFGGQTPTDNIDFDDFVVTFSDVDGTNVDSYRITKTEEPIPFVPGGISISEKIQVAAGTTRDQAILDLINSISTKKYDLSLSATTDQYIDLNNAGTNWVEETAVFNGRAILSATAISNFSVGFDVDELYLFLTEFYKANNKKEIVSVSQINIDASQYSLTYDINNPYSSGSIFAAEGKDGSARSFKSGSYHKLGIVYYDENNRSGGVQELGDVYVKSLKDRSDENNIYGPSSITMRINSSAPIWAKRWAPVYSGRGRTELKIQTGVAGAYIPFRTYSDIQSVSNKKVMFVSLNSLFGDSIGYNDSTGAQLSYNYSKGDRIRILSFGNNENITYEFNIVGFKKLSDDDDNPILDKSSEVTIRNTTGSFLIVEENPSATGFDYKSIISRNTNWFKNCVIEVYNTSKDVNNIYYEVGRSYEVSGTVHSNDRTSALVPITVSQGSPTAVEFNTSVRIFKGDVLVFGGTTITVGNVYQKGSNFFAYATANTTAVSGTYIVTNPSAVIDLEIGDVYFRRRALFATARNRNKGGGDRSYPVLSSVVRYIEDYSVSDFIENSKFTSIGRPISYIPDAKTIKRKGSITYSDYDSEDSTRLNLSSFNLSLANYKDLAYEHGSIKYLVGYNEALYFLQEKRCGVAGVGRSVVQTGSGDNLVSLSTNVIGNERYYVGEYGVGSHPESVAFKDGMIYFSDVNANKVLRIDSQGLTVISDVGMSSYFENKFGSISKYNSHLVGGGIDDDNDHYVIHSGDVTTSQVHINTDAYSYDVSLDSTGTQVTAPVQYDPAAVFGFLNDPRTFDDTCDFFDNGVEAVVYLDQLSSGAPVYTSLPYQASNVLGVATNSSLDFFVMIRLNMFIPAFIFDNNFCDTDANGTIDPSSSTVESFTAAYGTASRKWETRYSFVPERIDSLHSNMYSFSGGKIYKHDENASRNTFYGAETAESLVEVISNPQPSAIKTFESISIEGNSSWDAVVTTSKQTSTIDDTSFKEKEGFYYSYIHGATSSYGSSITSVTSTSEIFSLGEVSSVSGSTVTFKNALSTSFPIGSTATLYKVGASDLNSLSVTPVSIDAYNKVTFSGTVTAVADDLLIIVGNSAVEGDQIRDYYAKIKLTKTSSTPIELFAINTIVADSKAHN